MSLIKHFFITLLLSFISLILLISTANSRTIEEIKWLESRVTKSELKLKSSQNGIPLSVFEIDLDKSLNQILDIVLDKDIEIHAIDSDLFLISSENSSSEILLITDYEKKIDQNSNLKSVYLSRITNQISKSTTEKKDYLPDFEILFSNVSNQYEIYVYEINGEKNMKNYFEYLASSGWLEKYKKTLPHKDLTVWQRKINSSNDTLFVGMFRIRDREYLSVGKMTN